LQNPKYSMRHLINLIEEAQAYDYDRIVQMIDDQDGLFAYPDDDDEETGIWPELLQQCIDHAKFLASKAVLRVHRVMTLDQKDIDGFKPGDALGQHWAYHSDINPSALTNSNPNVLFVGDAHGTVAIEPTAAQNYIFPDEHEVVFSGEATIVITGIFEIGTKKPLRQDLWGKKFRIA
jgi:hypothetical protein